MTKISIIIFIEDENIEKCLNSIIKQNLEDIEILCYNKYENFSINSLELKNNIIYKKEEDVNKLINQANGEYILFMKNSDWLEPNGLKKLYTNVIKKNDDVILFNSIKHTKKKSKKIIYYLSHENSKKEYEKNVIKNVLSENWCGLYKKSYLIENNIKFSNNIFNEYLFYLKANLITENVSYLSEFLYNYKNHTNKIENIFYIFDEIEKFLKETNLFDDYELDFSKFMIKKSKINLNKYDKKEKETFFQSLRTYFISYNMNPNVLKKLNFNESKFYINIINSTHYIDFKKFNDSINHFNYINKKDIDDKIKNFKTNGITSKKRDEKIIISLTSFPPRMKDIHYCLYSLLSQEFKPDEVVLWLSYEEFPNKEKDIPKNVLNLKNNGLTIKWCENIGSYKKLLPALKEYPDDFIVTADDDIYYPKDWLKVLWEEHEKYPNCIISHRSRKIKFNKDYSLKNYTKWNLIKKNNAPSYLNFPTNGAGSLFCPHTLSKEIFNEDLFLELCPHGDDIWIWGMATLNKTKTKVVKYPMHNLKYINPIRELNLTNDNTLWAINKLGFNDIQIRNILNYFPEILETIL